MDVNGTRYHLFLGEDDWRVCPSDDQPSGTAGSRSGVVYDRRAGWLTLEPLLSLFSPATGDRPPSLDARRGAAADRFGNWYWIANDRRSIFWLPTGQRRPSLWWSQVPPACPPGAGGFGPVASPEPGDIKLAGLAITDHHYLVVGAVAENGPGGLFRFDLHAGGEPLLLRFPAESSFVPFDLAPGRDGGVWVLDRVNRRYWGLDRQFRLLPNQEVNPPVQPAPLPFRPPGEPPIVPPAQPLPTGFPIPGLGTDSDPIAIAGLPDGTVLILDSPGPGNAIAPAQPSLIHHLDRGLIVTPAVSLTAMVAVPPVPGETSIPDPVQRFAGDDAHADCIRVLETDASTAQSNAEVPVVAYDMTYVAAGATLYVIERSGQQAIAFDLDRSPSGAMSLRARSSAVPLHAFGERALVAFEDGAFVDICGGDPTREEDVRWVRLYAEEQPRYLRAATIALPVLDGKERGCVWDRLLLDACLPPETFVRVATRAADDRDLLLAQPFDPEPVLYRRGRGAELPYYDPFADRTTPSSATGTWELLCQRAHGQYLQIRLELSGNGRASPGLRALRAYYPRFSYPKRYLPAVYQDDPDSASFLERLLANPQGFYTDIEGKIAEVGMLFDARSAPPETLDWLAGWLGLVLDPLWADIQRRRAEPGPGPGMPDGGRSGESGDGNNVPRVPPDRRRLFIRYALRLYERRGTPDGVRFALQLLLDPCLELTLRRFKRAAVREDAMLRAELTCFGLPYPTPVTSDQEFEDLLLRYLLSPCRPSKIRLVERFLTRGGRALVAGDTSHSPSVAADNVAATAHRFTVLVPEGLSTAETAMVTRVVDLEKPAHTAYEVRYYWDAFRIGESRLAIDTVLGEESRFVPIILGEHHLGDGYLSAAPPMDAGDRFVSDRDRLGMTPL